MRLWSEGGIDSELAIEYELILNLMQEQVHL